MLQLLYIKYKTKYYLIVIVLLFDLAIKQAVRQIAHNGFIGCQWHFLYHGVIARVPAAVCVPNGGSIMATHGRSAVVVAHPEQVVHVALWIVAVHVFGKIGAVARHIHRHLNLSHVPSRIHFKPL